MEGDVLWDTAKYIRRMERRLAEKPHSCNPEAVVYAHVLYSKACKKQLQSKFSSALCFWRCMSCFWTVQASEGGNGGTSSRSGQAMNIRYGHKPAVTLIGFSTATRPEEGYQKCPEFRDKEYAKNYARL